MFTTRAMGRLSIMIAFNVKATDAPFNIIYNIKKPKTAIRAQ